MNPEFLTFTIGDVTTICTVLIAGLMLWHKIELRVAILEEKVGRLEEKLP